MENKVIYHNRLPLGMVKGVMDKVYTPNGSILTIRDGKLGSYVRYNSMMGRGSLYKNQNIQKLYDDLFKHNKVKKDKADKEQYVQTIFSKGDLQRQNRSGNYVLPTNKTRVPIISVSGHFIRGPYSGKKVSEVPSEYIKEIQETEDLNYNERLEIKSALDNKIKTIKTESKSVVTSTFKTHPTGLIMKRDDYTKVYYRLDNKLHQKPVWDGPHGDYTSYRKENGKWAYINVGKLYKELFGED